MATRLMVVKIFLTGVAVAITLVIIISLMQKLQTKQINIIKRS